VQSQGKRVQPSRIGDRGRAASGKWSGRVLWAGLFVPLLLAVPGCASFWDDVTSRDFNVKTWFNRPSPLAVLGDKDSDGNLRARALASLREPLPNGGNQKEQDLYVLILTTAATSDKQPLCRLAAIKSLGMFKDPRAVEALARAYYDDKPFPPETNAVIRQQALTALGETGSPKARDLLVKVVGEPPPAQDTTEVEKQQVMDCRLAAVRALGKYSHKDVTETLVKVLQSEKDVAMRDRAHESLVAATGKNLPPDPKKWEEVLHQQQEGKPVAEPNKFWTVLVGWWH
jgi:hypothetical protein